jgi:amino acid transporter
MIKLQTKHFFTIATLAVSTLLFPQYQVLAQGFKNFTWYSPIRFTTVDDLVIAILEAIITIAVPVVVLMIIYGGFTYVTAQGNPEQIKKATRTLSYAIIGGILIIGATAIMVIMQDAIDEFTVIADTEYVDLLS